MNLDINKIYYSEYIEGDFAIIKPVYSYGFNGATGLYYKSDNVQDFYRVNSFSCNKNTRVATIEEKQWLEACIEANKYISKEEALKNFNNINNYSIF